MSAIITLGNADFSNDSIYKVEATKLSPEFINGSFWRNSGTATTFRGFARSEKTMLEPGYTHVSAMLAAYMSINPAGTTPTAHVIFWDENNNVVGYQHNLDIIIDSIEVATVTPPAYKVALGYICVPIPEGATQVGFSMFTGIDPDASMEMATPLGTPPGTAEFYQIKKA